MAERSFEVGEFDCVALAGACAVVVEAGSAPSVRAEGDEEAVERLDVRVDRGTLRIGSRRHWLDFGSFGRGATVYVTAAPTLDGATISGSGIMTIGRIETQAFRGAVSGSGRLRIEELRAREIGFALSGSGRVQVDSLEAEQFESVLSGSGSLQAAGTAENSRVRTAGSGSARLDRLQTRRTSVSASGSGSAAVRASEAVEGSLSGSGSVIVHGTAHCSISRTGSGQVRCAA